MNYKCCSQVNEFKLTLNGCMNTSKSRITFCCENLENIPSVPIGDPKESLDNLINLRKEFLLENFKIGFLGENNCKRNVSETCTKCANFVNANIINHISNKITSVNFSVYPAPCQCKCIYCHIHDTFAANFIKEKHEPYYEKIFNILEYGKEKNIISKHAYWQISSGEITIHPYKDRIFNLVKDNNACFFTNAFIFDEQIANNLSVNPHSKINLSIDSGTAQTWHKVKGVNNFETVLTNLIKYSNCSSRAGQITLKYIVLPGINDTVDDYNSLVEIMKILNCNHLSISRNTTFKYTLNESDSKKLINSAAHLVAVLQKNNITFDMFPYTSQENKMILELAKKIKI